MPNNQITGSYSPAPRGATIETAYVGREVKVYGVLESEMSTIAMFNTLSTTFFSLSAGSLFCAVGIWANRAFAEKLTAAGEVLAKFGVPALVLLSLVFGGIAIWAWVKRGSTWDNICKESKSFPQFSVSTSPSAPLK